MLGTQTDKYKIKDGYLYIYDSALKIYDKAGTISSTKIEMKGITENEDLIFF